MQRPVVDAINIAQIYTGLGEKDKALRWLERIYEEHLPRMEYITDPIFEPLHAEPRFQALLDKLGIEAG